MNMNEILKALIDDEVEAVNGYDKALAVIKNPQIVAKLTEIRNEEMKHIEELNAMIFDEEDSEDGRE